MSFSQALSGLNAAQSTLGVLGNNIANSQTVGFKGSSSQFADVFANSMVGMGARVADVKQDFTEGNLESTNRNLDLAVAGNGFYRFEQEGEVVYSRNGQLTLTPDGYLENASGARIMGYGIGADGQVQLGGQVQVMTVPADEMPASATTMVNTTFNLDAREQGGQRLSSSTLNDGAGGTVDINYHYSNTFSVFDSLGNARNVSAFYEKVGDNSWQVKLSMDGRALGGATPTTYEMEFSAAGLLQTGVGDINAEGRIAGINFDNGLFDLGGADDIDFDLTLMGSTQFGNTSTTSSLNQDGFTSGALIGITVREDGTVMRNYGNEQSRPAGQIALANFRNPEGLKPVGDNAWVATNRSGQELVGSPGTGMLGSIVAGAVETSNVDMAKQLVDMIVAQRAYQANSQTIKTQDDVLQTAINLR